MLGMSRIVSVTAAQKVSAANGSSASCPPACSQRSVGAGWSVNPMPSNPARSAVWAKRRMASRLISSGLYGWVTSG